MFLNLTKAYGKGGLRGELLFKMPSEKSFCRGIENVWFCLGENDPGWNFGFIISIIQSRAIVTIAEATTAL